MACFRSPDMAWPFSVGRLPRIEFGSGSLGKLPGIVERFGRNLLLVVGKRSLLESPCAEKLWADLRAQRISWQLVRIAGEPSPEWVDDAVREWRNAGFDAVAGIGGGSVLDAAKAIAGLLKPGNSVMDHLEGAGPEKPYLGPVTPLIAVPTTAGTGSEATRNAVLSRHGPQGFKKSFRDEKLVPEYALVDPDLLASCPPALIAANGMDAFTQLLESLVSIRSNAFTDALAVAGIEAARDGLLVWYEGGASATQGRERMAYAALVSGICLAQAGLGSVHGLAQPLGSLFPIPHGVVCGTLVAAATRVNIEVLQLRAPESPALAKYARVGRLLGAERGCDDGQARTFLLGALADWTRRLALPPLSSLGVAAADLPRIIANCRGSSMKTNPIVLEDAEVERILSARL